MQLLGSAVLFSVLLQAMVRPNTRGALVYVAVLGLETSANWTDRLFMFSISCLFSSIQAGSFLSLSLQQSVPTEDWQTATSVYNFSAVDIDGNVVSLEKYR